MKQENRCTLAIISIRIVNIDMITSPLLRMLHETAACDSRTYDPESVWCYGDDAVRAQQPIEFSRCNYAVVERRRDLDYHAVDPALCVSP